MTDQPIPDVTPEDMEHARDFAEEYRDSKYAPDRTLAVARVLQALLPPPPPPTLADMTMEDRLACKWLQADLNGYGGRVVILSPYSEEGTARARVMYPTTRIRAVPWERITPRPDLPRMEWPGDKKVEDVTPVKVGDVFESADDPRVAALPDGTVLVDRDDDAVIKWGGDWSGDGYIPRESQGDKFGPWTVLHVGREADQ